MATLQYPVSSPKRKREHTMPLSLQVGDLTPPCNSDEVGSSSPGHSVTRTDSPRTLSVTGNFESLLLDEHMDQKPFGSLSQSHRIQKQCSPRKRLRFTPPPFVDGQESGHEDAHHSQYRNERAETSGSHDGQASTSSHNLTQVQRPPASPPLSTHSPTPSPKNLYSPTTTAGRSLKRKKSPPPDEICNPHTWHESEITGHLMSDSDDDGTGINGIGFRPTPGIALARARRRRQQVAEWKAREDREARKRRHDRRTYGQEGLMWTGTTGGMSNVEAENPVRVRFA